MTDPDRPPVPIATAARQLGITTDAVRARLRRGSLQGYRDNLGRWLVLMPGTDPTDLTRLDDDRSRPDSNRPDRFERDAVVQAVREHIETVKAELEREREQSDRLRVELAEVSRKRDEAEAHAWKLTDELRERERELSELKEDLQRERLTPWWRRLRRR